MKIAAIYDIHGNLPALDAVLSEISHFGVDLIVVGGDVVPGPLPIETLELLLSLDTPTEFITGNGEVAVLEAINGREPAKVPEPYRPIIHWTANQIGRDLAGLMSRWPKTFRTNSRALGDVLFCHATPRNEDEIFTRLTPEERLLPVFASTGASVVVCGHTHMQFDRAIGTTRVLNAGSVGMPFGEPGAYWLLLGDDIQLKRTAHDLERAAKRIRSSAYPQAGHFAENNVLNPASEAQMLELFSRAELNA